MAESLGFLKLPAGRVGGCEGCFFAADAIPWIVEGIARETKNEKILYLPNATVFVALDEHGFSLGRGAESALMRMILELLQRPRLETVIVNAYLLDHATALSIGLKNKTFRIRWIESYGAMPSNKPASELIKAFFDGQESLKGGGYEFEVEYSACAFGPQSGEVIPPGSKEPEGYCKAWSALMLIYSVATDGARPDQVTRELVRTFKGKPLTFVRNVTKNVARLVREQVKPSDEECARFLLCCGEETYCSPINARI